VHRHVGGGIGAEERGERVVAGIRIRKVNVAGHDRGQPTVPLCGGDRFGQGNRPEIELVVSQRGHVVTERRHRPVVDRIGGEAYLDQRAHLVVARAHGQCRFAGCFGDVALPFQEGRSACDATHQRTRPRRGRRGVVIELGAERKDVRMLVGREQKNEVRFGGARFAALGSGVGVGVRDDDRLRVGAARAASDGSEQETGKDRKLDSSDHVSSTL
jgi:hypothetical protein